ncbi:MAG: hypothetical protein VX708_05325 [Candidatus Thermoplasmatota archaeon]|jgi:large-conductance mechanosensitive channel|nr:hypothetical protein [Candidatus Thermoplasmatota archaeon]
MADKVKVDGGGDTSHLYEGKTVRSSAPSRKKAAGRLKSSTEIPKDAIPEIHVPSFIESFFGGPVVSKQKFLPADRMVSSLQVGAVSSLVILSFLTLAITPVSGTAWFAISNIIGFTSLAGLFHLSLIVIGLVGGAYGIFQRDKRAMLISYVALILVTVRFAGSTVEFRFDFLPEGEIAQKFILILYAVFLVMYIELSSGVIRFSMLDTSIRMNEVYVMGVNKITRRYHTSLAIAPVIAGVVALMTLLINLIIPAIVDIFDGSSDVASERLRESVELTSVYGVALGTAIVFLIIAIMFGVNLPLRIQQMRERNA